MNTRTPQRPTQGSTKGPVKGSWEDLFQQAQQFARNYNDAAIPLYRRVVDGLAALPPAARKAGNNRLHNIMMAAGLDLQGYYNVLGRYDDALATIDQLRGLVSPDEQEMLDSLIIDILIQAARTDEAFARLRTTAEAPDADLGDWGQLVMAYVRAKQPEAAFPVLDAMAQQLEQRKTTEQTKGEGKSSESDQVQFQRDQGYILGLRAVATLEAGQIDAGIALFDEILRLGGSYADNLHLLYGRLLHQGRYDDALRYIERDQKRVVRATFWRGVALKHKGEETRARHAFENAIQQESIQRDMESMMEHILAYYYLGDPQAQGLEIVLRAIREQRAPSWILMYLAGLGWAIRGDANAARTNIELAMVQRKSAAEGIKLPYHYWFFAQDLLTADQLTLLAIFFETSRTAETEEQAQD